MKIRKNPESDLKLSQETKINLLVNINGVTWAVVTNGQVIVASISSQQKLDFDEVYTGTEKIIIDYITEKIPSSAIDYNVRALRDCFGKPEYISGQNCTQCYGEGKQTHNCENEDCYHFCTGECFECGGSGKEFISPKRREMDFEGQFIDGNIFAAGLAAIDIGEEECKVWRSEKIRESLMISGDGWRLIGMGLQRP